MSPADDPLHLILTEAAHGRPPPADGTVQVMPAPEGSVRAVLAFTAHHIVVADIDEMEVTRRLPPGDLGAPMSPGFLLFLAGWLGAEPGALDVVVALTGAAAGAGVRALLAAGYRPIGAEVLFPTHCIESVMTGRRRRAPRPAGPAG